MSRDIAGNSAAPTNPRRPAFAIAKWFDNHTAAISITYDGRPDANHPVNDSVLDMGLVLDYEMVTQAYVDQVPDWVEHDLTELIPHVVPGASQNKFEDQRIESNLALTAQGGGGFFGHGLADAGFLSGRPRGAGRSVAVHRPGFRHDPPRRTGSPRPL